MSLSNYNHWPESRCHQPLRRRCSTIHYQNQYQSQTFFLLCRPLLRSFECEIWLVCVLVVSPFSFSLKIHTTNFQKFCNNNAKKSKRRLRYYTHIFKPFLHFFHTQKHVSSYRKLNNISRTFVAIN